MGFETYQSSFGPRAFVADALVLPSMLVEAASFAANTLDAYVAFAAPFVVAFDAVEPFEVALAEKPGDLKHS